MVADWLSSNRRLVLAPGNLGVRYDTKVQRPRGVGCLTSAKHEQKGSPPDAHAVSVVHLTCCPEEMSYTQEDIRKRWQIREQTNPKAFLPRCLLIPEPWIHGQCRVHMRNRNIQLLMTNIHRQLQHCLFAYHKHFPLSEWLVFAARPLKWSGKNDNFRTVCITSCGNLKEQTAL